MDNTKLTLAYGRRTYPDDVKAVWGARLIWPNDLLYDRQDLAAADEDSKSALIAWLNGPGAGDGALSKALLTLREPYKLGISQASDNEVVIYEDEIGKIVGSPQSSHGYVYVCGWLKEHTTG